MRQEQYEGYLIEALSYKMDMRSGGTIVSPPKRKKRSGGWIPRFRIRSEANPEDLLKEEVFNYTFETMEQADRSAVKLAKAWIDEQKKRD